MVIPESVRKSWAFTRKSFAGLWKFFVGGVIVAVGFIGNFVDLKQPDLKIEITEIQQRTSADIDIQSSPAFSKYRELMAGDIEYRIVSPFREGDPFKALQLSIDRKVQEVADANTAVAHLRTEAEKVSPGVKSNLRDQDQRSHSTVTLMATRDLSVISRFGNELIEGLDAVAAKKVVEGLQAKVDERRSLIKQVQEEIDLFRAKSERTDAKIEVTAAITNSGDGATTLKPQALLRADLGQGNYLDINLKISSYGDHTNRRDSEDRGNSEIKPRGASIVKFESAPISDLAPQDQRRFLDFFRNTSPTNLFVVDVKNNYYRSNTIPFAQGIYEQRIFDGLKSYATSQLGKKN